MNCTLYNCHLPRCVYMWFSCCSVKLCNSFCTCFHSPLQYFDFDRENELSKKSTNHRKFTYNIERYMDLIMVYIVVGLPHSAYTLYSRQDSMALTRISHWISDKIVIPSEYVYKFVYKLKILKREWNEKYPIHSTSPPEHSEILDNDTITHIYHIVHIQNKTLKRLKVHLCRIV